MADKNGAGPRILEDGCPAQMEEVLVTETADAVHHQPKALIFDDL